MKTQTQKILLFVEVLEILLTDAIDMHIAAFQERDPRKQAIYNTVYKFKSLAYKEFIKTYDRN